MNETKVEVHIWGLLIGYFIGFVVMYLARCNVENGYELFAVWFLGLLLIGAWSLGAYYALEDGRNDR